VNHSPRTAENLKKMPRKVGVVIASCEGGIRGIERGRNLWEAPSGERLDRGAGAVNEIPIKKVHPREGTENPETRRELNDVGEKQMGSRDK